MIDSLGRFLIGIFLAAVGGGIFIYGIINLGEWLHEHKSLRLRIRRLDDGRYYVKYWWGGWEESHREYIDAELLPAYLGELVIQSLKESGESAK